MSKNAQLPSETYIPVQDTTGIARLSRRADICPIVSQGSEISAYNVYCGHVIDPEDAADTMPPADTGVATFQACLDLCDLTDGCNGLSYIEASTTCYLHKGNSRAAMERSGWDGAIKIGAQATTSSSGSSSGSTSGSTNVTKTTTVDSATNTTTATTGNVRSSTQHTPQSSGLAPGAIAGVVLGVITLLGLALLVTLLLRRRKRQQKESSCPSPAPDDRWGVAMWIMRLVNRQSHHPRPNSKLRAQLLAHKQAEGNRTVRSGSVEITKISSPITAIPISTLAMAYHTGVTRSGSELGSTPWSPRSELEASAIGQTPWTATTVNGSKEMLASVRRPAELVGDEPIHG